MTLPEQALLPCLRELVQKWRSEAEKGKQQAAKHQQRTGEIVCSSDFSEAGTFADELEALLSRAATTQAGELRAMDRDEDFDRTYIPLPGGWEVQTKGKGSSFRICDTKTGERLNIIEQPYLYELLEKMAREIHAASQPVAPVVPDGALLRDLASARNTVAECIEDFDTPMADDLRQVERTLAAASYALSPHPAQPQPSIQTTNSPPIDSSLVVERGPTYTNPAPFKSAAITGGESHELHAGSEQEPTAADWKQAIIEYMSTHFDQTEEPISDAIVWIENRVRELARDRQPQQ